MLDGHSPVYSPSMIVIFRKIWPLVFVFGLFIACSVVVQSNHEAIERVLLSVSLPTCAALYFGVTVLTVLIPFTSVLPFVPLAVLVLGWPFTAVLTSLGWVLGGLMLFELSRSVARPYLFRMLPKSHIEGIGNLLSKKGLPQALFVRMVVHDDLVNVAFGAFTTINRWEFLLITALATAPGAVMYAYIGSVPFRYALLLATSGLVVFACYWYVDMHKAAVRRWCKALLGRR